MKVSQMAGGLSTARLRTLLSLSKTTRPNTIRSSYARSTTQYHVVRRGISTAQVKDDGIGKEPSRADASARQQHNVTPLAVNTNTDRQGDATGLGKSGRSFRLRRVRSGGLKSPNEDEAASAERQFLIATSTPESITQDDILQQLSRQFERRSQLLDDGRRPSVGILVTPSFASWLDDTTFLSKMMTAVFKCDTAERIGSNSAPAGQMPLRVSSLLAVVDGLPLPKLGAMSGDTEGEVSTTSEAEVSLQGESQATSAYNGTTEGLAFICGDHKIILPRLFETIDPKRTSDDTQKAYLSFRTDLSGVTYGPGLKVVVPLANTLFKNGRAATLLLKGWERTSTSEPFHVNYEQEKRKQSIRFSPTKWADGSHITAPLVALTPRRYVKAGLGNIIRQITDADGQPQPASTELEAAVEEYFKARNIPKQPVSVWALLAPPVDSEPPPETDHEALVASHKLWDEQNDEYLRTKWSKDAHSSYFLNMVLKHGGKLHRVVSGGGGWGVKAGLLSLDPQTSIHETDSARYDFGAKSLEDMDNANALKDIAKKESSIQFYILSDIAVAPKTRLSVRDPLAASRREVLMLGCIPSTIDDIPNQSPIPSAPGQLQVYQRYFGAQSEQGVFINTHAKKPGMGNQYWINYLPPSLNTKLDVPFATFSQVFCSKWRNSPRHKSNRANLEKRPQSNSPPGKTVSQQGESKPWIDESTWEAWEATANRPEEAGSKAQSQVQNGAQPVTGNSNP